MKTYHSHSSPSGILHGPLIGPTGLTQSYNSIANINHIDTRTVSETQRVATISDNDQGVESGPPYPSARILHDFSTGIRLWTLYYLDLHPGGMVGYRPTQ
jgi:hypothetical protein